MSTKVASSSKAITDQAKSTIYDNLKAVASWVFHSMPEVSGGTAWATSENSSKPSLHYVSPKAVEANRQIERVKSLSALCTKGDSQDEICLESIASSVALLGSFSTGPLPVPVASSGSDGGTTLFFDGDGFYGDLEIRGKTIEYFIKKAKGGKVEELYDCEEIEGGRVPPKLLACLYSHYAR